MSSHFMPEPRSRMISASSAGDHFDCFLAGEPKGRSSAGRGRLLGAAAAGFRLGFCSKTACDIFERWIGCGGSCRDCCRWCWPDGFVGAVDAEYWEAVDVDDGEGSRGT